MYSDEILTKLGRDLTALWGFVSEESIIDLICQEERCLYIYYQEINDRLIHVADKLHRFVLKSKGLYFPFILPDENALTLRNTLLNHMKTQTNVLASQVATCSIIKSQAVIRLLLETEPVLKPMNKKIKDGFFGIIIQIQKSPIDHDVICFKLKTDIKIIKELSSKEKMQCAILLIQNKCQSCDAEDTSRACPKCNIARYCSRACERFHKKYHARHQCDEYKEKYNIISA